MKQVSRWSNTESFIMYSGILCSGVFLSLATLCNVIIGMAFAILFGYYHGKFMENYNKHSVPVLFIIGFTASSKFLFDYTLSISDGFSTNREILLFITVSVLYFAVTMMSYTNSKKTKESVSET